MQDLRGRLDTVLVTARSSEAVAESASEERDLYRRKEIDIQTDSLQLIGHARAQRRAEP